MTKITAQGGTYLYPHMTKWERVIAYSVWLFFTLIPFNHVRVLSNHFFQEMFNDTFQEGWSWLSRPQDISNSEWSFFRRFFPFYFLVSCLQSLAFQLFQRMGYQRHLQKISIVFTLVSFLFVFHYIDIIILLVHILASFFIIQFKSKKLIWIWVIGILYGTHFHILKVLWLREGNFDDSKLLLLFSTMMCYLRITSFGLEFCINKANEAKTKKDKQAKTTRSYGIIDYLSYILYFPLFFNGPVLTFNKFQLGSSVTTSLQSKIPSIGKELVAVVGYAFLVDVGFHYLYSSSLARHDFILEKLNCIQTASIIWVELQFFYFKYLVFYPGAGLFLEMDGMESPGKPICISSLYTFAAMWRYFDKGLYQFLTRYIYFPIGGSQQGIPKRLFASFCCFAFVSFWHGADWNVSILWGITNWIGICLEALVAIFSRPLLESEYFSGVLKRRMVAFCGGVNIGLLILSNMIFLNGFHTTKIYAYTLFVKGFPLCPIALILILYCGAESMIDVKLKRKSAKIE